jgi:hypothetical protein
MSARHFDKGHVSEKPKCFHFGNWAVMFAKKDRFFELLDEQNAVLSDSE